MYRSGVRIPLAAPFPRHRPPSTDGNRLEPEFALKRNDRRKNRFMSPRNLSVSMLCGISAFILLFTLSPAIADPGGAPALTGPWVDSANASNRMGVHAEQGLLRVIGGDAVFGYRLSCLQKQQEAVCTGDGGQLEGENFLYQSTLKLQRDGTVIEDWKAFNNLQTVNGTTTWRRP